MPSPPGPGALFAGFFRLGIVGFGGVLPWARRMVVEQRRWLTAAEFTDLVALCQFLPGPNIVNVSVALGARFAGVAGAVAALTGLLAAPIAVVIGLGMLYDRFGDEPVLRHAFAGLAAAASGLVLATAVKIAAPMPRRPVPLALAAVGFAAIALLRAPLVPVMAVLAPAGLLLAWRSGRA